MRDVPWTFADPAFAPGFAERLGNRRLHAGVEVADLEEAIHVAADLRRGEQEDLLSLDVFEAERLEKDGERLPGRVVEAGHDKVEVKLEAVRDGVDEGTTVAAP